jgi:long-chain fatty acid transport protein
MTSRARVPVACVLAAAAGLLAPAAVRAQGFGLNEIGTCAVGRGAAVTSAPCADASSLYWNPGAVSSVPQGTSLYVGGSAIQVKGNFREDVTGRRYDGDVPVEIPPFLGFTVRTVPRLVLGMAAYVPYGLTSQWRDDFPGRFSAQRVSLQTFYVQPTAAYDLIPGRLSVGLGAVFGYSKLELRQALDLSNSPAPAALLGAFGLPATTNGAPTTLQAVGIQPGTEFGRVGATGDAIGGGIHAGVQARVTNSLSVGARYLSKVGFKYRNAPADFTVSPRAGETRLAANNPFQAPAGTPISAVTAAQFAAGGALGPGQTASTDIDHPAQLQAGIAFTGLPGTTLSADVAQVYWSSFKTLPVSFFLPNGQLNAATSRVLIENYKDARAVRVGLEHKLGSLLGMAPADSSGGVALRLGFAYAEGAAPPETVTPLLPDMNRYNFSGGLGIPLGRGATLDLAYLRVETRGRRGRTGERPDTFTPEQVVQGINNGFYALNANVLSASIRANLFR